MLLELTIEFVRSGKLNVHIIGDGPQKPLLEEIVNRSGIRQGVHFHGWVPHPEVQKKLRTCDFLALPSVREFGGGVVLEAMALGVTPIVADYAGPAELIDEKTGIRISFSDRQSLIDGLRNEIGKLLHDRRSLDVLGAAGRATVQEKFHLGSESETDRRNL